MGSDAHQDLSAAARERLTKALIAVFRKAPADLSPGLRLGDIGGWDSMNAVTFTLRARDRLRRDARRNDVHGQPDDRRRRRRPAANTARRWHDRRTSAEAELRSLIAELTRERPEAIDLGVPMDRQGLDSLQLIILRERLETNLAVVFSDDEWMALDTPASVLARVTSADERRGLVRPQWARTDLEIGMPLTGRNNLAETPLLQYLGDQRWRHISDIVGVPSREIVDDAGERLYATFYYVEVAFPPGRPMASFGENDRLTVFSSMSRATGRRWWTASRTSCPSAGATTVPYTSVQQAVDAGIPAVRLSNIFVKQFVGAQWLKKGRPAHPNFARIPALADPPDSVRGDERSRADGHVCGAAAPTGRP